MSKKTKNTYDGAERVSSYQLERQAQRQRTLLMQAYARMAAQAFAEWLRALAQELAQRLATDAHGRAAVRALQQLDDRTLADIGVPRSEIETAVRCGQVVRLTRKERLAQDWSGGTDTRQAA
jgi:uncharacterized protein YjiS (DUF1127 family)